MPSSASIGRIEVTSTSPGTTSAIQELAAARASSPTPPSATTSVRPTARAPMVRVARLRSRNREARARRSSNANGRRNGSPPRRARTGRRNGMRRVATSSDRVHRDGTDGAGRAGVARPDEESGERDREEHDHEPAQAGAPGGRQVESGPKRLDRGDPRGAARRFESRRERDQDPDGHGGERVEYRQLRSVQRHRADGAEVGDDRGREQRPERDADRRPDDPRDQGLVEDEGPDLALASRRPPAAGRPRGSAR